MSNVIGLASKHVPPHDRESVRRANQLAREVRAEIARSRALLSEARETLHKIPPSRTNFD